MSFWTGEELHDGKSWHRVVALVDWGTAPKGSQIAAAFRRLGDGARYIFWRDGSVSEWI